MEQEDLFLSGTRMDIPFTHGILLTTPLPRVHFIILLGVCKRLSELTGFDWLVVS